MLAGAAAAAAPPLQVGWSTYNNTYDGQRFSPLSQLDRGTVGKLRLACEAYLGDEGSFESGLLVVGQRIYVNTPHTVVALDATNCAVVWRYVYTPEEEEVYAVNRGSAYADGKLFRGTGDGRLLALDAASGRELWRVQVGDPKIGEFFSSAPIVWNGLVFAGPAGGDWGIHGRVSAYDAASGKEVWRFNIVPQGNEPGAETWKIPETAKHGGGATWTSYTLDPATGELFVPVGNPAPDFLGTKRPGENLYTDAVVALDAASGKLKWYYQLLSNDSLDYDLGAAPMLYTDAEGRERVALGSKDGYVYLLDRASHSLLTKVPVTTILNADKLPTPQGLHACPGTQGGIEWNGPAYSPRTHLVYAGAVDWCATFKSGEAEMKDSVLGAGKMYYGTGYELDHGDKHSGWVVALDDASGTPRWRYHAVAPVVAGVTPTAGGLVFAGDLAGHLVALDAATGKPLFSHTLEAPLMGGIATYAVDGRQYVAATLGGVSRLVWHTTARSQVAIFTTGLPAGHQVAHTEAAPPQAGAVGAVSGRQLFGAFCGGCHGGHGEGGSGPSLVGESARKDHAQLVHWIEHPQAPMPSLYPSPLSAADVEAAATYVETLK